jgi:hypothetical protein
MPHAIKEKFRFTSTNFGCKDTDIVVNKNQSSVLVRLPNSVDLNAPLTPSLINKEEKIA